MTTQTTLSGNIRSRRGVRTRQKSPWMTVTFLALWILPLVYYGPRLWQIATAGRTLVESALLFAYCAMLAVFWLLAAHYTAVVLFYFFSKSLPLSPPPANANGEWLGVAILYPTCNDFQADAAASCLNQNYPHFHLFLLDDSTKDESRAAVEAFHETHPDKTTIVRRSTRQGFKAGNLNHALGEAASKYPLFAVVDADERLPSNFLHRAVPYLRDPDLAFVQANHKPNPAQEAVFARDIAPTILPFWNVHCQPRNRYGFVVFLGHGAVVRRSAWEAVGGFPEVATEDLAFSMALGEKGLRGVFLEDLVCYEDFPENYVAFKRQQERYLIGTTQVLLRHLWSMLRSRKVSLVEKIDLCMWCSPLYVPALALAFVALCTLGLAVAFGRWEVPVISILGRELALPPVRVPSEAFNVLGSLDFQVFSTLSALSPAFACVALGLRGRLRAARLLFLGTVPYLSLTVVAWRGVLRYLFTGRIIWPPTGECSLGSSRLPGRHDRRRTQMHTWQTPIGWETLIGVILTISSLLCWNLAFSALSCCLLLGVGIQAFGWEKRLVRVISAGCFGVILLQMLLNVTLVSQSPGVIPLIFSVHF
jgi:cellulose synthase/poly-beta-1,6-N-acetylglucosamine synthase-like glycosyltransferase